MNCHKCHNYYDEKSLNGLILYATISTVKSHKMNNSNFGKNDIKRKQLKNNAALCDSYLNDYIKKFKEI
jgi:hypothetical protein